jgi:glycosyltransferase involved in cell wall biosynthesis
MWRCLRGNPLRHLRELPAILGASGACQAFSMPSRRVVLFIWRLSGIGGMQQHVVQLALALRAHGADVAVATIALDRGDQTYFHPLDSAGIPVIRPDPERPWKRPVGPLRARRPSHPAVVRLLKKVAAMKPDVLHIHGYLAQERWIAARAVVEGLTVVYTDHGDVADLPPGEAQARAASLAAVHALSAVSARAARSMATAVAHAEPHNPREVSVLRHVLQVPALRAGSREDGCAAEVLMVASMKAFKGHDTLLAAMRQLLQRGVHLQVTLAGDGPDRGSIEALAADLVAAGVVRFVGAVVHDRLGEYLSRAAVAVLPSRSESMPLTIFEYLAYGKAIVATPVGGVPEILIDGENALLVPVNDPGALADAIERLLGSPELRARLGAAARATFERLNPSAEAVLGDVTALYDRAICAAEADR